MHGSDMDTEAGLLSVKVKTAQRWDRGSRRKARGESWQIAGVALENKFGSFGKKWDGALVWLDAGFLFKPRQLLRQAADFPLQAGHFFPVLFLEIRALGVFLEDSGSLLQESAAPLVHLVRLGTILLADFSDRLLSFQPGQDDLSF